MSIAETNGPAPRAERTPADPMRLSKLAASFLLARRCYGSLRRQLGGPPPGQPGDDDTRAVVYASRQGYTATAGVLSYNMDRGTVYVMFHPLTGDPVALVAGDDPAVRVLRCELLPPFEPRTPRSRAR